MTTLEAIQQFSKQFEYEPVIENGGGFEPQKYGRFIFCGMGGSVLAPDLLRIVNPALDIIVHRDYGLPTLSDEVLKNCLIVINSYSGNTEETLSAFNLGVKKNLPMAVITTGGELLKLAQEKGTPYIQMPNMGIEPRMALGLNLRALLKIIGDANRTEELSSLSVELSPSDYESAGQSLSGKIKNSIPLVYSSRSNGPIAYAWKVIMNETAKVPAFSNVFPELNHNEMVGFELPNLSRNFCFVFLKDNDGNQKITKRMEVTANLLEERQLAVSNIELSGKNIFHKIFSSIITAHWTAYYLSQLSGTHPDGVPMVEKFKELIK